MWNSVYTLSDYQEIHFLFFSGMGEPFCVFFAQSAIWGKTRKNDSVLLMRISGKREDFRLNLLKKDKLLRFSHRFGE
jgi:hypothetical protein